MTDEVKTTEEVVATTEETSTVETAPRGYKTKEQFVAEGNDPKDYVTPEEFERRGQYFNYIKDLKKQIGAVVEQNQLLVKKVTDAELRGYQNAIKELELRRQVAVEQLDTNTVKELDKEIAGYQHAAAVQQQQSLPKEVYAFAEKHKAELSNPTILERAKVRENLIRMENPGFTHAEVFEELEKQMFNIAPKSKPIAPPVAGAGRATVAPSDTLTMHDLNDNAKSVFKALKSVDSSLTLEKYVETAKRTGTYNDLLRGN